MTRIFFQDAGEAGELLRGAGWSIEPVSRADDCDAIVAGGPHVFRFLPAVHPPVVVFTRDTTPAAAGGCFAQGAASVVHQDRSSLLPAGVAAAIELARLRQENQRLEALQVSTEQWLEAALDASPGATILVDAEGRVKRWSQPAVALFGLAPEQVTGSLFPLDACGGSAVRDLLAGQGGVGGRVRHQTGEGRQLDLEVRGEAAGPGGLVVVFVELATRASLPFRAVFEQGPAGMGVASLDGTLAEVNAAFSKMLGYSRAELAGLRWDHLLEPSPGANLAMLLGALAVDSHSPSLQSDARFRHKSGAMLDVQWNLCLVRDPQGTPLCQIGQISDISRRKQAEKKLEHYAMVLDRSNQDLQQFAYMASHDLQEPLRMVKNYLELFLRRYGDTLDHDAREFLGFATDGASRMQGLIQGLLSYSRVHTQAKEPSPVDPESSLRAALANLHLAIEECGASIEHTPMPRVRADSTQLTQLFQNLLANSLKFRSGEAPRIQVAAQRQGNQALFSVGDNGIGLDPAFSDRAFQMFQRLHPQSKYPGAGIGLAICKRIAERHGGRIWVESEPGLGATFRFTLPLAEQNAGEDTVAEGAHGD